MSQIDTDFLLMRTNRGKPVEISKATAAHMLDVLPPKYGLACYAMGEAHSHEAGGAVYYWCCPMGGKHWGALGTADEAGRAFSKLR